MSSSKRIPLILVLSIVYSLSPLTRAKAEPDSEPAPPPLFVDASDPSWQFNDPAPQTASLDDATGAAGAEGFTGGTEFAEVTELTGVRGLIGLTGSTGATCPAAAPIAQELANIAAMLEMVQIPDEFEDPLADLALAAMDSCASSLREVALQFEIPLELSEPLSTPVDEAALLAFTPETTQTAEGPSSRLEADAAPEAETMADPKNVAGPQENEDGLAGAVFCDAEIPLDEDIRKTLPNYDRNDPVKERIANALILQMKLKHIFTDAIRSEKRVRAAALRKWNVEYAKLEAAENGIDQIFILDGMFSFYRSNTWYTQLSRCSLDFATMGNFSTIDTQLRTKRALLEAIVTPAKKEILDCKALVREADLKIAGFEMSLKQAEDAVTQGLKNLRE